MMQTISSFQLKGSLLTFTVLQLLHSDLTHFNNQLEELVKKTPNFFKQAPIIIDLEKLNGSHDNIDLAGIKAKLLQHGLIPVGIRNANEQQTKAAIAANLGIMSSPPQDTHKTKNTSENKGNTAKLISQTVRSGQRIYAQQSDLIVLASVGSGAELLADGNIHVYGTLRGRALAGVAGNTQARIFCSKLEAELVSIAGFYRLSDDIKVPLKATQGIQIYLAEEHLHIDAI